MRYLLVLVFAACDSPRSTNDSGEPVLTWGLTAEERVAACLDGLRILCGGDGMCGTFGSDEVDLHELASAVSAEALVAGPGACSSSHTSSGTSGIAARSLPQLTGSSPEPCRKR